MSQDPDYIAPAEFTRRLAERPAADVQASRPRVRRTSPKGSTGLRISSDSSRSVAIASSRVKTGIAVFGNQIRVSH